MGTSKREVSIRKIYQKLYSSLGPQGWWPAKTRLEVIIGAILVQNTNWNNTKKAIENLRLHRLLSLKELRAIDQKNISFLIRSSGYFRMKAKRLKNFVDFLFKEFDGSLNAMARRETGELREKLLSINGVGPETADSILLYAFKKPVFVVDTYTERIFSRHGFFKEKISYQVLQDLFLKNLIADVDVFNEYHALIVYVGKTFCKARNPLCEKCPLRSFSHAI